MLIEFRVSNHRSIREEQVLTLEQGRVDATDDARPRSVPGATEPLLPVAAIYGANASGKSNVIDAIGFMAGAVALSHHGWPPDEGVPRDPFAWGPARDEPSLFECSFVDDGVRHEYGFRVNDAEFVEEWLYAWPHGRKQVWFERDGDRFTFGENLVGEKALVQQATRPNSLYLSAGAQNRHAQLMRVYAWFRSVSVLTARSRQTPSPHRDIWLSRSLRARPDLRQRPLFPRAGEEDELLLTGVIELLKVADVGIVDIMLDDGSSGEAGRAGRRREILLKHATGEPETWLPLSQESAGTQTLMRLAGHLLESLRQGGLLVVDELESSLHPLLGLHLVKLFNDPTTNPHNAQLIFSTHDTNLLGTTLGPPALRRDQVWLTEKGPQGATTLYPLADYKPRKAENVETGYLQGRYGAIPFLGDLARLVG